MARKDIELTKLDNAILQILHKYGKLKARDIYQILKKHGKHIDRKSIYNSLNKLCELGLVTKEIRDNVTYFSLADFQVVTCNGTLIVRTQTHILVFNCPYYATCNNCSIPDCPLFKENPELLKLLGIPYAFQSDNTEDVDMTPQRFINNRGKH